VSSQLTNQAAALFVAILEMEAFGRSYANQVIANALTLGNELERRGFELRRIGNVLTKTNVLLIRSTRAVGAYEACDRLIRCGIAANARPIDHEDMIRIGTQEVTRLGMREPEMERAVLNRENAVSLREDVKDFKAHFRNVHFSFDREFGLWHQS
jgi:glycine hydroxymethyltransferase